MSSWDWDTYALDIEAGDLHVEYGTCGSHKLHVVLKLDNDGLNKLKNEIVQAEQAKEIELAKETVRVVTTDEETMGDYNTL
jgi:hypothetical protein